MARTAAVIDVGSNTVRLLVARCSASTLVPIHTERVRLGLGREIEGDGAISEETIAATAEAVRRLSSDARAHRAESVEVLVSSPGRQADNGAELADAIAGAAQVSVRILSAEEEAQLAFAGAIAVTAPSASLVAVVDVGGASTEIAVGERAVGPSWLRSVDLGALRLRTRLLEAPRPGPEQVEEARAVVAEAFAAVTPPLPSTALVVGGSARALGRILGRDLGRTELAAAAAFLPICEPDAVAQGFGIGKWRAELLLSTALILAEVQRRLEVSLVVAEGGVREGALLAAREAAAA